MGVEIQREKQQSKCEKMFHVHLLLVKRRCRKGILFELCGLDLVHNEMQQSPIQSFAKNDVMNIIIVQRSIFVCLHFNIMVKNCYYSKCEFVAYFTLFHMKMGSRDRTSLLHQNLIQVDHNKKYTIHY